MSNFQVQYLNTLTELTVAVQFYIADKQVAFFE